MSKHVEQQKQLCVALGFTKSVPEAIRFVRDGQSVVLYDISPSQHSQEVRVTTFDFVADLFAFASETCEPPSVVSAFTVDFNNKVVSEIVCHALLNPAQDIPLELYATAPHDSHDGEVNATKG